MEQKREGERGRKGGMKRKEMGKRKEGERKEGRRKGDVDEGRTEEGRGKDLHIVKNEIASCKTDSKCLIPVLS